MQMKKAGNIAHEEMSTSIKETVIYYLNYNITINSDNEGVDQKK